jgi:hypothetical protein
VIFCFEHLFYFRSKYCTEVMRFACLLAEHFPTRVEAQREPTLIGKLLVVLRDWDSHILDASPEALTTGVVIGDSHQRAELAVKDFRLGEQHRACSRQPDWVVFNPIGRTESYDKITAAGR